MSGSTTPSTEQICEFFAQIAREQISSDDIQNLIARGLRAGLRKLFEEIIAEARRLANQMELSHHRVDAFRAIARASGEKGDAASADFAFSEIADPAERDKVMKECMLDAVSGDASFFGGWAIGKKRLEVLRREAREKYNHYHRARALAFVGLSSREIGDFLGAFAEAKQILVKSPHDATEKVRALGLIAKSIATATAK